MIARDYLLKAMDKDRQIRVTVAHTTALVEKPGGGIILRLLPLLLWDGY